LAYLNLVEYDEGGRIQSLDGFASLTASGLAAVSYDSGRTRNLLGAELGAVKYDDGGRFRTLVGFSGLGQDPSVDMLPPDVGLDPSIPASFPISYEPPSPAPSMLPFIPSPVVDTTATDITANLTAPTAASSGGGTGVSALTSIFSGVKNIFSSVASTVVPKTAGTAIPLPGQPGYVAPVGTSWFSQPSALGVPNWGLLAGAGVATIALAAAMRGGGGGSSRRNPARRRRNPAELILMGANPRNSSQDAEEKRRRRALAHRRRVHDSNWGRHRGWLP
jgi:hypothetical protein